MTNQQIANSRSGKYKKYICAKNVQPLTKEEYDAKKKEAR